MSDLVVGVLSMAACVFGASASAKLRGRPAYRSFRAGLRETALIPERLLPAVTAVLVAGETLAAAGLTAAAAAVTAAAPGARPLSGSVLAVAAMLVAALAAGVAVVLRRGTRARCACFGSSSGRPLGRAHLVRNSCLLAVLGVGLTGDLLAHGRPVLGGALVAAAAGAAAAALFIRWDDMVELFAPRPTALQAAHPPSARPGVPAPGRRPR